MPEKDQARLWRFHKPKGIGLPKDLPHALPIDGLDIGSEGLLLLTNDQDVRRLMALASAGWVKHYRVKARARVDDALLATLGDGVAVGRIHYGPIEAAYDQPKSWLHVVMREGPNRGIGGICAYLKLSAPRIMRLAFGPFELGDLRSGAIEEVPVERWQGQLGGKFGTSHEDRGRPVQRAKHRSARG